MRNPGLPVRLANFFSLAPGPHPRRVLTLMPRLGPKTVPRLGMAAGAGFLVVALSACGGSEPAPASEPAIEQPAVAVYVTNETSGDLTIIDATKNTALATIPLGKRPRGIAVSPDRRFLYVALSGSPVAGPGVDESKLPPPDRSADGIGVVDIAPAEAGARARERHRSRAGGRERGRHGTCSSPTRTPR